MVTLRWLRMRTINMASNSLCYKVLAVMVTGYNRRLCGLLKLMTSNPLHYKVLAVIVTGYDQRLCGLLKLDELEDTILHLLDGLVLGETHAPLVGDIVDAADSCTVLTAGTADLEMILSSGLFKLGIVSGQLGDLNVDGGTDGGAEVGGAEGEEAEAVMVAEWHLSLNLGGACHQAAVYLSQVTSLLHGDDAKVIFLIDPDEEGLGIVVVDTTAVGPVAAGVSGLE